MKKALSLILALVMCLSLCACGGNTNPTTGEITPTATLPTSPAINATEPPTIPGMPEDNTTVPPTIPGMPEDNTTVPENNPAPNAKKLLTKLIITRFDNLGNEDTDNHYFYDYDEQGRIIKIGGHEMAMSFGFYLNTFSDYLKVSYTSEGLIENVEVTDPWDKVSALGTPTYDENGNMVSMHIQTGGDEFELKFAYDANGNRTRADIFGTFHYFIRFDVQYFYDSEGRLIKEVWDSAWTQDDSRTIEYTYDEYGRLIQSCQNRFDWQSNTWSENTVYSYDQDGDIIQAVTTTDRKDTSYKTWTTDFIYSYIEIVS